MSGNVYEWCDDWKGAYSSSSLTNPQGSSLSASRVRRGGGYCHYDKDSRVSFRSGDSPYVSNYFIGLRLSL
jgi:formylglycine-generating enzyme required for sulfatase activity